MQKLPHEIYSFGEFRLDLTRGALFRGDEQLKLRPKSFDVLKYLTENQGRLVGKDELIEAVWRGTAVTDDSLVQCLKEIRNTLEDRSQSYIKTVPRRGYIFEKDVAGSGTPFYLEESSGVHLVIEESEGSGETLSDMRRRPLSRRWLLAVAVVLVPVLGLAAWQFSAGGKEAREPMFASSFHNPAIRNLTHSGNIGNNAISSDGKFVVYTTVDAQGEGLWLRQLATDSTQQVLAPADVRFFGLSFSPDGNYIYFLRASRAQPFPRTLYRISTLGGVIERIVHDMDWCSSFSRDGRQMAFVRNSPADNESRLMIADSDGRNERTVVVRPLNEGYLFPAWSPDGTVIAASVGSVELGDSFRDVVTVRVADGVEKVLTKRRWYWAGTLAWLSDASGLIVSANPEKTQIRNQLWLLSYPGGELRRVTNDTHNYTYLSFTSDTRTLLAGHVELLTHIWIAPDGDAARARRVTSGLGDYKEVMWTADGKLVVTAFGNDNLDVFLRSAEGPEIRQLTSNAGGNWATSVSPDDRYIVFGSDRTGELHIWRMDIEGGNPIQLTDGTGEKFPEISPDGKWVVYTSYRDWTLWKVPIEGGEPVKIAESYARQAAISPDGKWIVYMASEENRQHILEFDTGKRIRVLDLPPDAPHMQPVQWSPDSKAIQFKVKRGGVDNIWEIPIAGGPPRQITNFTSDSIFSYDWAADGKTLAVIRGAWTADMTLLTESR